MGLLFALGTYFAYLLLAGRMVWHTVIVWERAGDTHEGSLFAPTPAAALRAMRDVVFFSRLFFANSRLWLGEWIFHLSFFLVMLRHLRYAVNPVPEWVVALQPVGVCAGYVLPLSLLYIVTVKAAIERQKYVSRLNYFLLGTALLSGLSGLFLRTFAQPDLVAVKVYMAGIFGFAPGPWPGSALFSVHLLAALVLLACLPTHVFAAPFSLVNSRIREEGLQLLMHEK